MIPACLAVVGLLALVFHLTITHNRAEREWAKERRLLNACIQKPSLAVTALHQNDDEDEQQSAILGADGEMYRDGRLVT